MPGQAFTHHPATYQPIAFAALGWPGTFDAAMQDTARRDILEHIATWWPHRPMENVISISRIDMQATDAAKRGADARSANPYPDHSPAGQLWLKCFAAELQRMAQATQAQAASVYTDDWPHQEPPMNHPHIIGLTGPAGSGKDTVADLLVVHAGFDKMAYADTLRTEVMLSFNIDASFLTQRETKETPMRCLALSRCLDEGFVARMIVMHTLKGERLDLDAPRSPRQIMQWWGTDYRRHQSADYWVSAFLKRARYLLGQRQTRRLVVTDCRFLDEVDAVRIALGGQLWQICRDGVEVAPGSHVSEVTGAEFRPDVVINNSHSVKHLQERVLEALEAGFGGMAA